MSKVITIESFPKMQNFWKKNDFFFHFLGVLSPYMLKWNN